MDARLCGSRPSRRDVRRRPRRRRTPEKNRRRDSSHMWLRKHLGKSRRGVWGSPRPGTGRTSRLVVCFLSATEHASPRVAFAVDVRRDEGDTDTLGYPRPAEIDLPATGVSHPLSTCREKAPARAFVTRRALEPASSPGSGCKFRNVSPRVRGSSHARCAVRRRGHARTPWKTKVTCVQS